MSVFSVQKTFRESDILPFFPCFPIELHAMLVYVFLSVSAVGLIAFGVFKDAVSAFFGGKAAVAIAGAVSFIGTLLLLLGGGLGVLGVLLAAIPMGAGASLFVILMGRAFCNFKFPTAVLNAILAVAIGFICAVACVNWIPSPISGFIATLMPLLMMAVFWGRPMSAGMSTQGGVDFSFIRGYVAKLCASMALFGFVVGALRVVCADRLLSSSGISVELVLGAACFISVIVVVLAIAASKRETYWDSLFRNVTPVIVVGMACMPALGSDMELLAAFFVALGFVCLVAMLWVLLSSLARNLNGADVFTFGFGYGIMQAASLVGAIVASYLHGGLFAEDPRMQMPLAELALAAIAVYSVGYALVPRYREMAAILSTVVRKVVAVPEAPIVQIKPRPEPTPKPIVKEEKKDEKGSFVRRCDEICAVHKLSVREKEVFFLLAKGHNAAFITEQLCISRSTTKTHINHIYKKIDVHTQQELLNMVEDRKRGPYDTPAGTGPAFGSMGAAVTPEDYDALVKKALETKAHHDAEMSSRGKSA